MYRQKLFDSGMLFSYLYFSDKLVLVATVDVHILDNSHHILYDKSHTDIHIPVR